MGKRKPRSLMRNWWRLRLSPRSVLSAMSVRNLDFDARSFLRETSFRVPNRATGKIISTPRFEKLVLRGSLVEIGTQLHFSFRRTALVFVSLQIDVQLPPHLCS